MKKAHNNHTREIIVCKRFEVYQNESKTESKNVLCQTNISSHDVAEEQYLFYIKKD